MNCIYDNKIESISTATEAKKTLKSRLIFIPTEIVGRVNNYKSMDYIGNIAEFIKYKLKNITQCYEVYNYVDKPYLNMNQLMAEIEKV